MEKVVKGTNLHFMEHMAMQYHRRTTKASNRCFGQSLRLKCAKPDSVMHCTYNTKCLK